MPYFLAPFLGWVVSGILKFLINYIRFGKEAKERIGNGGFPSTHTTIVTTPTVLIGLNEGWASPVFGLAITLLCIVVIDALGLRNAVGKQAKLLNRMTNVIQMGPRPTLRESMGHTKFEVLGGMLLGAIIAIGFQFFLFFLKSQFFT